MLPRRQRFKVWSALMLLGGWFLGCYALVAYRLKSDDLELMEREVYEELQKKKEVERYIQKQRREMELSGQVTSRDLDELTVAIERDKGI